MASPTRCFAFRVGCESGRRFSLVRWEDALGNAIQTWRTKVRYPPRSTNQPRVGYPQLTRCKPRLWLLLGAAVAARASAEPHRTPVAAEATRACPPIVTLVPEGTYATPAVPPVPPPVRVPRSATRPPHIHKGRRGRFRNNGIRCDVAQFRAAAVGCHLLSPFSCQPRVNTISGVHFGVDDVYGLFFGERVAQEMWYELARARTGRPRVDRHRKAARAQANHDLHSFAGLVEVDSTSTTSLRKHADDEAHVQSIATRRGRRGLAWTRCSRPRTGRFAGIVLTAESAYTQPASGFR